MWYKSFIFSLCLICSSFLILTFFSAPDSDDFCYAARALKLGAIDATIQHYQTWSGRYSQGFLSHLFSSVFSLTNSYWIGPLFVYCYLLLAHIILFYSILSDKANKTDILIIALLFFSLYLVNMPNIHQGIYWISGAFTYQFGNASFLLVISILIPQFFNTTNNGLIRNIIYCLFFTVLGIGTNEIIIVPFIATILIGAFFAIYFRIPSRYLWITTAFTAITASLFSIMAPGNWIRDQGYENSKKLFPSIYHSIVEGLNYFLQWSSSLSLWALTIICISIFNNYSNNKFKTLSPKIIFTISIYWILLLSACFFPVYYATGETPAKRVLNVIYMIFIIGWFSILSLILLYFKDKITSTAIPNFVHHGATIAFIIGLFTSTNFQAALDDIKNLDKRINFIDSRYRIIYQAKTTNHLDPIVPKVKYWSRALYEDTMKSDPNFWVNKCTANYFGLNSIATTKY